MAHSLSFLTDGVRLFFIFALCALSALLAQGCSKDIETPVLPRANLTIGEHVAVAEIAHTTEQHRRGLSQRKNLLPNHGMLFVFESERYVAFWMKDTYVPLSIAYVDSNGTILQIEDMTPLSEETHPSREKVRFALEMEQGWFRDREIEPGAKIDFPPELNPYLRDARDR